MRKHPNLADKKDTVLVIIDIQEKLYPHILENERLVLNIKKLIHVAKLLDIPIIVTEQENLGQTVKSIRESLKDSYTPIKKTTFSCIGEEKFNKRLKELRRSTFILTGIESHICIEQTALDLLENNFKVHVVKDAISSRKREDLDCAMNKMKSFGVIITSTETIIYELMERSDDKRFKEFLEIVKIN